MMVSDDCVGDAKQELRYFWHNHRSKTSRIVKQNKRIIYTHMYYDLQNENPSQDPWYTWEDVERQSYLTTYHRAPGDFGVDFPRTVLLPKAATPSETMDEESIALKRSQIQPGQSRGIERRHLATSATVSPNDSLKTSTFRNSIDMDSS